MAAYGAAKVAHLIGEEGARAAALEALGAPLPMRVVGPFENQQGRGFHAVYPPEREWSVAHKGFTGLGWRDDEPRDHLGALALSESVYDQRHMVAYAAQSLRFKEGRDLSLRVNSSAPVKVWWNGRLVFEAERLSDALFDVARLPLRAEPGVNRLLVKVAERTRSALRVDLLGADGARLPEGEWGVAGFDEPLGEAAGGAASAGGGAVSSEALLSAVLGFKSPLSGAPSGGAGEVSLYELFLWARAARAAGFEEEESLALEALLAASPLSLMARLELGRLMWRTDELGEAETHLSEVASRAGEQLPLLNVTYGMFEASRGKTNTLYTKTYALLGKFREHLPVQMAWLTALSARGQFGRMRYMIDYLKRTNPEAGFTLRFNVMFLEGLKQAADASAAAARWRAVYPGDLSAWITQSNIDERREDLSALEALWSEFVERQPHLRLGYERLGSVYLRQNSLSDLEGLIERWGARFPADPARFAFTHELWDRRLVFTSTQWEEARPQIIAAWRRAFKLYQGDYGSYSQMSRYDELDESFWDPRLPTDDEIKAIAAALPPATPAPPHTHVEVVRDLSIARVHRGGPVVMRRLRLLRPLTRQGVNQLRHMKLNREGPSGTFYLDSKRLYTLQPDGSKLNPASLRGADVRFAQLKPGSLVVVDVEFKRLSQALFGSGIAYEWLMQGVGRSMGQGEVEVWMDEGLDELKVVSRDVKELPPEELTAVHAEVKRRFDEKLNKRLERLKESHAKSKQLKPAVKEEQLESLEKELKEAREGFAYATEGWRARRWVARDLKALKREPWSAPAVERSALLSISTLSSWGDVAAWMRGLTFNTTRVTPQIRSQLSQLLEGAKGETERLERILRYVANELRYEQDYEDIVAGFRPHSAPTVARRGYGDCKDKATLFVALAREAGLKAEFALLHTAPVLRPITDTPSPYRFNHMIAYAPPQGDLLEERFFDGVGEDVDVSALPDMDQGARAFVLMSEGGAEGSFKWFDVPREAPAQDNLSLNLKVRLDPNMSARGTLEMTGVGGWGRKLRSARGKESRQALLREMSAWFASGADLPKPTSFSRSLNRPARVAGEVEWGVLGSAQSKLVSLRALNVRPLSGVFDDPDRTQPLVDADVYSVNMTAQIDLPPKSKIERMPSPVTISHRCASLKMSAVGAGESVRVGLSFELLCHTMPVDEYKEVRALMREAYQQINDTILVRLP